MCVHENKRGRAVAPERPRGSARSRQSDETHFRDVQSFSKNRISTLATTYRLGACLGVPEIQ